MTDQKPTDQKSHWEKKYSEDAPTEVSWYQAIPSVSLRLIEETGIKKDQWIIDVGGGASTLVDHLLDADYEKLAVLDISVAALEHAKRRLGERKGKIEWVESDVTVFKSKHRFSVWHDRAVFHFLTDEKDRQAYLRVLRETLAPGGHLIIATFALDGPKQCSGLDVARYDSDELSRVFGKEFELKESVTESHQTPWESEQKFVYCRFQFRP